jgi:hypothetical protein
MAYKTADLEKKALEAIEKHKLFFIEDLCAYLPCSRATFYNLGLDKLDTLKESLEKNKIEVKAAMRSKWFKSDAPALQIALYKIIGTEEESDRINSQKIKAEVKTEITEAITKAFDGLDDEEVQS